MKNHLLRLAELIQENFPEDLLSAFKSSEKTSHAARRDLITRAISSHRERAAALWQQANKQRSPEERYASAQADLASFVFGYLTGDAKEYADSALEALHILGRQAETDLIRSLCRK